MITTNSMIILVIMFVGVMLVCMNIGKKKNRISEEATPFKPFNIESYDIRKFLNKHSNIKADETSDNIELNSAVSYLKAIDEMFSQGIWNINKKENEVKFQMMNTTDNTISKFIIRYDVTRSDETVDSCECMEAKIKPKETVEFYSHYNETRGTLEKISDSLNTFVNNAPVYKIVLRQNPYTLTIDNKNATYDNTFVRALAGLKPINKNESFETNNIAYDSIVKEFGKSINSLPERVKAKGNEIAINLEKLIKYSKDHKEEEPELAHFITKYLPTLINSIKSFNIIRDTDYSKENICEAEVDLLHTFDVFDKAIESFTRRIMDSVSMNTSVDQEVLEQQMIREGLYNPFDDK